MPNKPLPTSGLDVLRKKRFTGLDLFRFVLAASIVYLHTVGGTSLKPTSSFARCAVPFFTASAVFFAWLSATSGRRHSIAAYCLQRVTRIYVPFLLWTLFYIAFRLVGSKVTGSLPPQYNTHLLWTGSSHHLWFLPFVFVATSATFLVVRLATRGGLQTFSALVIAAIGFFAAFSRPDFVPKLGYTAALSWDTLPSLCWTYAAVGLLAANRPEWLRRRLVLLISLPCLIASLCYLQTAGRSVPVENTSGVFAFAVGLTLGFRPTGGWGRVFDDPDEAPSCSIFGEPTEASPSVSPSHPFDLRLAALWPDTSTRRR